MYWNGYRKTMNIQQNVFERTSTIRLENIASNGVNYGKSLLYKIHQSYKIEINNKKTFIFFRVQLFLNCKIFIHFVTEFLSRLYLEYILTVFFYLGLITLGVISVYSLLSLVAKSKFCFFAIWYVRNLPSVYKNKLGNFYDK